jgi:hypothetical protein
MMPLAGAVGCGGGKAKSAALTPGEMPEGATWKGVYFSQLYGNLHLVEDGDEIKGAWRTVAGELWGEMVGKADGNVYRYEWTEHRIGMVGPSAERKGHGYFRYVRTRTEETKTPDEIHGEWGLGDDETGNSWKAVLQVNVEPDLKSVRPNELETSGSVQAGGWDEGPGAAKEKAGAEDEDDKAEDDKAKGDD